MVPFMLYAGFDSTLKPVDGKYREKEDQMKTARWGKTRYTKKINTHISSEWGVHSTFAYGVVLDPLKMYHGKCCIKKFVEHIEDEVKQLYSTFPQQPMTELNKVLKRQHETAKTYHIF